MKKFSVLAIALTFSGLAFGNTVESVFSKNSKLPQDMKALVLAYINSTCSAGVSAYGLKEVETVVEGDSFTTIFETTYYADRMHPSRASMVVKSAKTVTANGTSIELSPVDSIACEN